VRVHGRREGGGKGREAGRQGGVGREEWWSGGNKRAEGRRVQDERG